MSLRIVIVGGVAGGMSAATRARRANEQAQITVLEKTGHISFANCGLPYFIAGKIKHEESLYLTTPERVKERFAIDARVHHEVTQIDRVNRRVLGKNLATGEPFSIDYDKLILAPGASPIVPKIPGIDSKNVFVLRNVEDTLAMKRFITEKKPARAVVVGGGFIGLEMVEALHEQGLAITLLEKAPHALPAIDSEMSGWIEAELQKHQVTVKTGTGLSGFETEGEQATHVLTDRGECVATDLVLLSMGVRPNTGLAELAAVTLGPTGAIAVDEYQRTSDPNIYAVGDAAEVRHAITELSARIPLAGAANRHGRLAGQHAATGAAPASPRVLGTAIVRVFGLDVGMTGYGLRAARNAGYDAEAVIIHPNDHAGYYPGAQQMHLMLVYEKSTGRVLGAQAAGPSGIDKRIDVIATAIHFDGKIEDLTQLDLSYAPQFAGAKDPVHFAGFVAENNRRGFSPTVLEPSGEAQLVDVRTVGEFKRGALPSAINIPLDTLRVRLAELDRNRPVVVYCQVGVRGHVATRILLENGFCDVKNLTGGYVQAALRTKAMTQ